MIGEIKINRKITLVQAGSYWAEKTVFDFDGSFCFRDTDEYLQYNRKEAQKCEICETVDLRVMYSVIMMKLQKAGLLDEKNAKRVCCFCYEEEV